MTGAQEKRREQALRRQYEGRVCGNCNQRITIAWLPVDPAETGVGKPYRQTPRCGCYPSAPVLKQRENLEREE